MSDVVRSIQTDAGPIEVRALAEGTIDRLGTLFPKVGWIDHEGRRLLALLPAHGPSVLKGLRAGYGWYPPEQRDRLERMLAVERLRIVEAAAAFRTRGFQGVLMPAACLSGAQGDHLQLGELLFLRARGPLTRGLAGDHPIRGYEDDFGTGATSVLLSFVGEICKAWKGAGVEIKVTDLEPCRADWRGAQWRADILLVDDKIVVIRPALEAEDPLLLALVRAGVAEIEHTPSVLVIQPSDGALERN